MILSYMQSLTLKNEFIQHIISINDTLMLNVINTTILNESDQNIYSYLVGLIIGQKISFRMAQQIRSRLYSIFNSRNFTPQQILNLTVDQWKYINISEQKQNTIIATSHYAINKNLYDIHVIQEMQSIKGIGNWTTSCLLIQYRMLNDEFPLNDVYVNNKLKQLYNIDVSNPNNIKIFVERWAPYKSFAFHYLWKFQL